MPLYRQVREQLNQRLIDGDWQAGDVIPSEIQIARELGVSQGTVRKAIDEMVRDNILRRKQGRGTFVANSDDAEFVFQFFNLKPDSGERILPTSKVLSLRAGKATAKEAGLLQIGAGSNVHRIERIRLLDGRPVIVERLILPGARFDRMPPAAELPNNVYDFYAKRWGVRIFQTDERIKAGAASARDAGLLDCAEGTPLLCIERVALDLSGQPIELRLSNCLTTACHYSGSSG